MRTLYLFLLLFPCLLSAQNYDYHPDDWFFFEDEDFQFKVPIQKVEAITYILTSEGEKGEKWQADILNFDKNRLVRWDQHDFQFGQNFSQIFKLDKSNSKYIEREIYTNDKLIETTTYNYDENSGKITEIIVKEFDEKFENAPPLQFEIEVVFNMNNERIKDVYYDYNSNPRHQIEIKNNSKGQIISRKHFDKDGNWQMTDSIVYYDNGQKSSEISYYKTPIEEAEDIRREIQYKYDINGHILEMKVEENIIQFQHILDENGHWIERKSYVIIDGEANPYQLVERNISY